MIDLGAFHEPPLCDPAKPSQKECFEPGCGIHGCNYTLSLDIPRGTQQAYTLQVQAKLYASTGPETPVQWTYKRCSESEVRR